jgi:hypothetical protein
LLEKNEVVVLFLLSAIALVFSPPRILNNRRS